MEFYSAFSLIWVEDIDISVSTQKYSYPFQKRKNVQHRNFRIWIVII